MLDAQDIALLRGMFSEQETRILGIVKRNNDVLRSDIMVDVRDEMHSCITAAVGSSEKRVMNRIDQLIFDVRLCFAEILDERILPQITHLQEEIYFIKHHVGLV